MGARVKKLKQCEQSVQAQGQGRQKEAQGR